MRVVRVVDDDPDGILGETLADTVVGVSIVVGTASAVAIPGVTRDTLSSTIVGYFRKNTELKSDSVRQNAWLLITFSRNPQVSERNKITFHNESTTWFVFEHALLHCTVHDDVDLAN